MHCLASASSKVSLLVVFALAGCGDDASPTTTTNAEESSGPSTSATTESSESTDPTTTTVTTTATTTQGESSGSESGGSDSGSGDSGSSDTTAAESSSDDSTGTPVCEPVELEAIAQYGLAGDSACEGVPNNAVIADETALDEHFAAFCTSLTGCMDPPPPCPMTPELEFEDRRIAYVFGDASGCTGSAQITEIEDCGDTIEVHYTVGASGPCGLVVYGFDAAWIPGGDAEVVFIEE